MKIPTSLLNMPFSKAFNWILDFHLNNDDYIWDCTCGEKKSWESYNRRLSQKGFFEDPKYNILFSDILDGKDILKSSYVAEFDACYFDPPYIWGLEKSKDKRQEIYGGYTASKESLQFLIRDSFHIIKKSVKNEGKIFFKYTDIFDLSCRKFYFGVELWNLFDLDLEIIDHFIIQHHHISPTAYQVKNRPCSIGNFSYLTVFKN